MIIFFKYFIDWWYIFWMSDQLDIKTWWRIINQLSLISTCLSHLITTLNKALSVLRVFSIALQTICFILILLLLNSEGDWLVTIETHVDLFQIIFQIFLYSSSTTSTTHPQCSWGLSFFTPQAICFIFGDVIVVDCFCGVMFVDMLTIVFQLDVGGCTQGSSWSVV